MSTPLQNPDAEFVAAVVQHLKSKGYFDSFRKECLSDCDTRPSFQNLRQRVEGYVSRFLSMERWSDSLNKNQLRETLRRQLNESGMLKHSVEHLVENQIVNPKINTVFLPKIESVVKEFLGIKDEVVEIKPTFGDEMKEIDERKPTITSLIDQEAMEIDSESDWSDDGVRNENVKKELENKPIHDSLENLSSDSDLSPARPIPESLTDNEDSQDKDYASKTYVPPVHSSSENNDSQTSRKQSFTPDISEKQDVIIKVEKEEESQESTSQSFNYEKILFKNEKSAGFSESSKDSLSNEASKLIYSENTKDEKPEKDPKPVILVKSENVEKLGREKKESKKPEEKVKKDKTTKEISKREEGKETFQKQNIKTESRDSLKVTKTKPGNQFAKEERKDKEMKLQKRKTESSKDKVRQEKLKKKAKKAEDDSSLSDVSSVHTSDLSDFDDEISVSSGDDSASKEKKKISLKEVKQITTKLTSSKADKQLSGESSSGKTKKLLSKREDKVNEGSERKRVRKVNPKYTSEEYSSIFNKKKSRSGFIQDDDEDESEEEEDEEVKEEKDEETGSEKSIKKEESNKNVKKEVKDRSMKKEDVDKSSKHSRKSYLLRRSSTASAEVDKDKETNKESLTASDDSNSHQVKREKREEIRTSSRASMESNSSQETLEAESSARTRRKKTSRSETQTQRYDASDLYKPRPVISSRRNRTQPQTQPQQQNTTTPETDNSTKFFIHDFSK